MSIPKYAKLIGNLVVPETHKGLTPYGFLVVHNDFIAQFIAVITTAAL